MNKQLSIIDEREVLGKDFKMYGSLDKPLFIAKDVADWIEHSNVRVMLKNVDDNEKIKIELSTVNNVYSRKRNLISDTWFLTEDGLYEVLMQSRKPIAKEFKKQIKAILKDIRKHGMYATDDLLNNPDLAIATFQALKEERNQRRQLEQKLQLQQPLVEFAKTVQGTNENILVRECSKLASNYIGVDIGEKKLYQKLRQWRMLLKSHNEPSKLAYKMNILEYTERVMWRGGKPIQVHTTKVTPKGQVYIINKLIKELEMNETG